MAESKYKPGDKVRYHPKDPKTPAEPRPCTVQSVSEDGQSYGVISEDFHRAFNATEGELSGASR
mgnify:CR=1 FL=1